MSDGESKPKTAPNPPKQPESGPGGADYHHAKVLQKVYGKDEAKYWLFEPISPEPQSAPLIVFYHGWGAKKPFSYIVWIRHIVRRGNIVVYPVYQDRLFLHADEWTPNAVQAIKDAITRLQSEGHVQPELDKFAIVGHSLGGAISANVAALALSFGLPEPDAVMVVQPGSKAITNPNLGMPLENFGFIPESTLMLVVVAADDNIVDNTDAKKIFLNTPKIPLANKDYVVVLSDSHGSPALVANHFAPIAPGESSEIDDGIGLRQKIRRRILSRLGRRSSPDENLNALDYYGYWKLFDGLTDAAFYGKNREYALGNTPKQRFMGRWSDGTPVKELIITDNP